MIQEKTILKSIKEYGKTTNEYWEQAVKLEKQLYEYLDKAPEDILVTDEYIQLRFPEYQLTNVVVDKLEKLIYKSTDDHRILIPVPRCNRTHN